MPNIFEEAILIDKENGDNFWWDAIMKEMNCFLNCVWHAYPILMCLEPMPLRLRDDAITFP